MDSEIQANYDSLSLRLEFEKKDLVDNLLHLERKLRFLLSQRNRHESDIEKLQNEISELETEELMIIEREPRSKEPSFNDWTPNLRFQLETCTPIQEVELDPKVEASKNGHWIVISSTKYKYNAEYIAKEFRDAKASVILKGYKKDVHAEQITKCKKQVAAYQNSEEIDPLKRECADVKADIKDIECRISAIEKEQAKLDGEIFPLRTFGDRAALFLSGRLYSTCQAYGLATIVTKSKLPPHSLDQRKGFGEL